MKEYCITYTYNAENGTRENINIIERSEAAARKDFKAHHKDGTILDIELIAEDVTATKDQEREALAKIKQMVEELGPQSYIGTAFEGCWQDAEDNIEYDYGCSMKQKLESAEFAEDELRGKLADAKGRLEELGRMVDSLKEEKSALEAEFKMKALPECIRQELWSLVSDTVDTAREHMAIAAENMATMAEAPQDIAFVNAVNQYRRAKERRDRYERLLSSLDTVKQEDAGT